MDFNQLNRIFIPLEAAHRYLDGALCAITQAERHRLSALMLTQLRYAAENAGLIETVDKRAA